MGQVTKDEFYVNKKELFKQSYGKDKLSRIISVSGSEENLSYEYDLQGRLTKVLKNNKVRREYNYDGNGNRISFINEGHYIKAAYDSQDRLVKYGKAEYQYNENGDLSAKIIHEQEKQDKQDKEDKEDKEDKDESREPRDVKVTKYSIDVFGNLKLVTLPSGKVIEYIIDGQNRRVGKKINGKLVQGFVYQGQNQIVAELDSHSKLIKQFIYGSKANIPDLMIVEGKEYRIISDQVGTPRLVVDVQSGKVIEELEFDEFGVPRELEGKSLLPFGFAGGLFDRDTKLVRFGARDYDAEIGRWIRKDPIRFAGGDTNLYGYVSNDPVNGIDTTGLFGIFLTTGGAAGISSGPRSASGSVIEGSSGLVIGIEGGQLAVGGIVSSGHGTSIAGGAAGVGLNLGVIFGDVSSASGGGYSNTTVLGPIGITRSYNPQGGMTGFSISPLGKGGGLSEFNTTTNTNTNTVNFGSQGVTTTCH